MQFTFLHARPQSFPKEEFVCVRAQRRYRRCTCSRLTANHTNQQMIGNIVETVGDLLHYQEVKPLLRKRNCRRRGGSADPSDPWVPCFRAPALCVLRICEGPSHLSSCPLHLRFAQTEGGWTPEMYRRCPLICPRANT